MTTANLTRTPWTEADLEDPVDHCCSATSKRSGKRCRRAATPGANVCYMHGAAAPQVKAKAAERVADEQARAVLTRLGMPVPTDPIRALRDLLDESNGNVAALRSQLLDLGPGLPQDPFLRLYDAERDRLHRVAKDSAAIDLDERRLRIDGATARLVMSTFEAVLARAELGLDVEHRELFKQLFVEELRGAKDRVDAVEVTTLLEERTT